LTNNHNHPNPYVRVVVIQSARKMEREAALSMLKEHFDDHPDGANMPDVGANARQMYKSLISSAATRNEN